MAWCVIACGNGYGANALSAGVGAVSIGGFGVVVVVIVIDQLMSNLGLRAWLKSDNERSRFL